MLPIYAGDLDRLVEHVKSDLRTPAVTSRAAVPVIPILRSCNCNLKPDCWSRQQLHSVLDTGGAIASFAWRSTGSFGFQLGASSNDVIMLFMNQRALEHLLQDKVSLGGEAAVAAGPLGRNASADTDVMMHAEILTWSRSRGIFAGLSLEGATLHTDVDENEKLNGRKLNSKDILSGDVPVPEGGRILVAALNKS